MILLVSQVLAAPKNLYGKTTGIPILMFHRFSSTGAGKYNIAIKDFNKILKVLSKPFYCLIDLQEYAKATFLQRCKGKKPIAISMDDGHSSQLRFLKNGQPDPNSGIGAMFRVFPKPRATLFLNTSNGGSPLGKDSRTKIRWLRDHQLVIGNHTATHPNLSRLSKAAVVKELDSVCNYYGTSTMLLAYSFGLMPKKPLSMYPTKCRIPAAFRAWLGYFEARGQNQESGFLLAPLPNTTAFSKRKFAYPRINISGYQDFRRDILENTAWVKLR